MEDKPLSPHAMAYVSAKNVKLLRDFLDYDFDSKEDRDVVDCEIVSSRDLPEFGQTEEDFHVVLVKVEDVWYADSVIVVDGSKPKAGDKYRFYKGPSFPLCRKLS